MKKRQIVILGIAFAIVLVSFGASKYFASQKKEPEVKKVIKTKNT
jgi:hypothetical protein